MLARLDRVLDLAVSSICQTSIPIGRKVWSCTSPRATARDSQITTLLRFTLPANRGAPLRPARRAPYRMIAAQIVLYVGLGIIIVMRCGNHWTVAHP